MQRLLILFALVAYAYAGMKCCSMEDRKTVLADWETMWDSQHSGRRIRIAKAIFDLLFEKDPETVALFKRVNVDDKASAEFQSHCIRVMNGLDTLINLAPDSDILGEALVHYGQKHANYEGMKGRYLETFRHAASDVLSQAIPCFNTGAWERCISSMQKGLAASLPN